MALTRRGYRIKTKYRINGYEIDIVLEKHRIAIECDSHKPHRSDERRAREQKISRDLRANGWTVIRIKREDIYQRIDHCMGKIQLQINKRIKNKLGQE